MAYKKKTFKRALLIVTGPIQRRRTWRWVPWRYRRHASEWWTSAPRSWNWASASWSKSRWNKSRASSASCHHCTRTCGSPWAPSSLPWPWSCSRCTGGPNRAGGPSTRSTTSPTRRLTSRSTSTISHWPIRCGSRWAASSGLATSPFPGTTSEFGPQLTI